MAIRLTKNDLKKLIKESVARKIKALKEDIDVDDDEIWSEYDDDNFGEDWYLSQGKMPKGYDDDITDLDTIDKMLHMNSNLPSYLSGSPAWKQAQIKASWAASDREDRDNADKLSDQYEDNYYNDSNANTDPDASAWHFDSYNNNLKIGLKDWL